MHSFGTEIELSDGSNIKYSRASFNKSPIEWVFLSATYAQQSLSISRGCVAGEWREITNLKIKILSKLITHKIHQSCTRKLPSGVSTLILKLRSKSSFLGWVRCTRSSQPHPNHKCNMFNVFHHVFIFLFIYVSKSSPKSNFLSSFVCIDRNLSKSCLILITHVFLLFQLLTFLIRF